MPCPWARGDPLPAGRCPAPRKMVPAAGVQKRRSRCLGGHRGHDGSMELQLAPGHETSLAGHAHMWRKRIALTSYEDGRYFCGRTLSYTTASRLRGQSSWRRYLIPTHDGERGMQPRARRHRRPGWTPYTPLRGGCHWRRTHTGTSTTRQSRAKPSQCLAPPIGPSIPQQAQR
jgi:hypothetical protein